MAKTKKQQVQQDEKILRCAKNLIDAIKKSGRETCFVKDGKVVIPVTLDIYVHDHYTPPRLSVEHINNGWEVHGDYIV